MQNHLPPANMRNMIMFSFLLLFTLVLSSCGFQLRGVADLSFKTLYIQGSKLTISRDLSRSLKSNGIQIVDKSEDAELLLELLSESNQKRIQSLSGGGLVREFELIYLVNYRVRHPDSPTWGEVQTIRGRRDFSYSDSALLGKAEEEARLNNDMRNDAIRELMRRLTAIKPDSTQK